MRIEQISLQFFPESEERLWPESRRSTGSLFQAEGADMANARGPIVKVCDLGTNNAPVAAERSCERSAIALTGVKKRAR